MGDANATASNEVKGNEVFVTAKKNVLARLNHHQSFFISAF